MDLKGENMTKKGKNQTTIFDQREQSVHHQVNIAGTENQTNKINLSSNADELFSEALSFVRSSELSPSEKEDIFEKLDELQREISKGNGASDNLFTTLLKSIVEKIPDVAVILLETILNPVAGASAGIKLIAQKLLLKG